MSQAIFFGYANRLITQEQRNRSSWAKELSVTIRTITNFNLRLKNEFGIVVRKTAGAYGYYYIDKKSSKNYSNFINLIQNLNSPGQIAESFSEDSEYGKHLIFHQNWNKVSWMKYFNQLVSATNDQHYISLDYHSFRTEKNEKLMYFMPYWMKQNAYYRWYIIGFENEKSTFPTVIGCDKINSLKTDEKKFSRKKSLEKFRKEYENIFGVYIYEKREPELVRIECTRFQAKYLKSLPLHISQEVESETNEVTIFRYKLGINHEFAYELMRQNAWNFNPNMLDFPHPHRTAIKVLEPQWLVDYFHQTYKRSYFAYARDLSIIYKLKKNIDEAENPYPIGEF